MSTVIVPLSAIELPGDIAEQARRDGLLSSQAIGRMVREAVQAGRAEKRAAFRCDAEAAWADYQRDGLHLTLEEADAWLAKLEAGEDVAAPACHA
ncbi:MAG: hypothetical protein WCZ65_04160 [Lysobacteraceae bacterium]